MQLSIKKDELAAYYAHVLDANFPATIRATIELARVIDQALARTERCFADVILPGYRKHGTPFFNHEHADQRAVFNYFAANSAYRLGDIATATRFFLLNKMQNALVCMYDTELPEIFLLIHTVGTVLGKASYGNHFVAYQNVTIGTESGRSATIDEHVVVYGGSMVIGATHLGRGSVVSAQSVLIDEPVAPNSIAIGRSPHLEIKHRKRDFAMQYWEKAKP